MEKRPYPGTTGNFRKGNGKSLETLGLSSLIDGFYEPQT